MKKSLFLLLAALFAVCTISAHSIKGKVIDENGQSLPGATIFIEALKRGEVSDSNGKFRFVGIHKGTYKIKASLIGYDSNIQEITWDENTEIHLTFRLIENTELSEIEVFGERHKQPEKLDAITRMPLRPSEQIQSISVISSKVISEQGALTVTDVIRNVPGVTLFGSYGGVKESFSSRGFRGIPVLKNGVRTDSQFQTASILTDMQGVESVQMIKGSAAITQGVITDIGNAGGVINVVTKTPKFVNGGEVGVRVGSWGQFRPTFDVQSVLDKNRTVAFRLNGAYERSDSYRATASLNKVYINPSLEWRPDDKTTITLELDHMNDDRTPTTSAINLGEDDVEALYKIPHSQFLGTRADNVNTKLTTYSARINRSLTDNLSVRAAYFNSRYQVDDFSTTVGTRRPKGEENYAVRSRSLGRSMKDDTNTTFQLDLIGKDVYTGSIKHTFQVGFDYRTADATSTKFSSLGLGTLNIVDDIISNDTPSATDINKFIVPIDTTNSKYSTYGIMLQEVMTINDYVKAIVGLRYSSISNNNVGGGITVQDSWDPMAGIMISPIKNVNIFGSYATSTSLRNSAYILQDKTTKAGAAVTTQWEAGIKSDWLDNRLRFNFTYFNILSDNLTNSFYEFNETTGEPIKTPYYFKAGNLRRSGVEFELNGRILENLQVMLGYAYLNARYEKSPSYVNGSAPMNAPKHTANGWVQYTVNKSALKGLSLGIGTYYVGERPINEHSTAPDGHGTTPGIKPFDMPSYITVNAQVGYTYKNVTARVFFNNIFDELGYSSYFRGGYINQIDPRNFAGVVSYKF